ncbi:hypothetical protein P689_119185 [Candidatus Riesia pediculischaeffi PTSU]|uniref:Uncharacterized protein n=1 Tax=Candidatus Riesia pediculischaeffi PTSU TaxID=1401651 RepID=A0A0C1V708_9ENTR|nr:hypothetical protein P689_119185 [Candidatus Riesia pediculischaeffi PTSU]
MCIPISPSGQIYNIFYKEKLVKAYPGIEPSCSDLQSDA